MIGHHPERCICGSHNLIVAFTYDEPLAIEVKLALPPGAPYRREYLCCEQCGHYVTRHRMDLSCLYEGAYLDGTYGDADKARHTFERIIGLPPDKSDNQGRIRAIAAFAARHFGPDAPAPTLLDIGSGLGVFPHAVRQQGWTCTALDPDPRATANIRDLAGVDVITGDFLKLPSDAFASYDIVTMNKVLEHLPDPVAMLHRAGTLVRPGGFVYAEVPDVLAARDGKEREEFGVDHYHVFSPASLCILCEKSDLILQELHRVREPSGKYTLRLFATQPL